jgi:hypothetical protein
MTAITAKIRAHFSMVISYAATRRLTLKTWLLPACSEAGDEETLSPAGVDGLD